MENIIKGFVIVVCNKSIEIGQGKHKLENFFGPLAVIISGFSFETDQLQLVLKL